MPKNNPSKPFWRGKTSADYTRFPAKTILAGNYAHYHELKPQARQTYHQTTKKELSHFEIAPSLLVIGDSFIP